MKKTAFIVLAAGLVFITLPAFFERLHSDEVIYWDVARNLSMGRGLVSGLAGGTPFTWHMPLPFFINAPALLVSEHIFTTRIVSSLFTVGAGVLVYLIAAQNHERDEAVLSALLFLFSFQALRYGGRFYLDQYGVFFFLLSVLLLAKDRPALAGASALLSVLAREYWAGVYPFFFVYILSGGVITKTGEGEEARKKSVNAFFFAAPLLLSAAVWLAALGLRGGPTLDFALSYLKDGALIKNILISLEETLAGSGALLRGWAETLLLNILVTAGFISWFMGAKGRKRLYILLVLPQALTLSLIHGFILNGGVTQYPLAIVAAMAPFSGPGLKILYGRLPGFLHKTLKFAPLLLLVILLQYAAFNVLATLVSLHQNPGVYGFGYGDDAAVVDILRKNARGRVINGIHGAFVEGRAGWDWTDFHLAEAIGRDPDWLVTFDNYVEVLPKEDWNGRVNIYNVGPYIIAEAVDDGALRYAVREKEFPKWKLRKN